MHAWWDQLKAVDTTTFLEGSPSLHLLPLLPLEKMNYHQQFQSPLGPLATYGEGHWVAAASLHPDGHTAHIIHHFKAWSAVTSSTAWPWQMPDHSRLTHWLLITQVWPPGNVQVLLHSAHPLLFAPWYRPLLWFSASHSCGENRGRLTVIHISSQIQIISYLFWNCHPLS